MFRTLIQYPMGVDYVLSLISENQKRNLSFPHRMTGVEFSSYLKNFRREDENVQITPEEIPDYIQFFRPDMGGLKSDNNGVRGVYIVGRINLCWTKNSEFHRTTGPALVELDQYRISFHRGDISSVSCESVTTSWYQEGKKARMDGPHTLKLFRFQMDRNNHRFQNPRFRNDDIPVMKWSPIRDHQNVRREIFEKVIRDQGIVIQPYAVHTGIFPDTMAEYLFWEAINEMERHGVQVYDFNGSR